MEATHTTTNTKRDALETLAYIGFKIAEGDMPISDNIRDCFNRSGGFYLEDAKNAILAPLTPQQRSELGKAKCKHSGMLEDEELSYLMGEMSAKSSDFPWLDSIDDILF